MARAQKGDSEPGHRPFEGWYDDEILALTGGLGNLVRFRRMPGQRHDSVGVPPLIGGITFDGLIADRAFDSKALVADLNARGAKVAFPNAQDG